MEAAKESSATPKVIWETTCRNYCISEFDRKIGKICDELGAEGWEPFHILPYVSGSGFQCDHGTIWFKRPKE